MGKYKPPREVKQTRYSLRSSVRESNAKTSETKNKNGKKPSKGPATAPCCDEKINEGDKQFVELQSKIAENKRPIAKQIPYALRSSGRLKANASMSETKKKNGKKTSKPVTAPHREEKINEGDKQFVELQQKMVENKPPATKQTPPNLHGIYSLESNATTSEMKKKNETNPSKPATAAHHNKKTDKSESQCVNPQPKATKPKPNPLALNPSDWPEMFDNMNLVDLFSMAERCANLYNSAKQYFEFNYGSFDFASLVDGDFLDVDKASKFLRIFGTRIQALKISRDLFNNEDDSIKLLQLIANTCRKNLKALELDGFNFKRKQPLEYLETLVSSIEALALDQCSMHGVTWRNMNNLKVLKLNTVDGLNEQFWQTKFNNLKAVELNHMEIDEDELKDFIRSARTIKRLSIVKCCNVETSSFEHIKSLKNLKELEYQLNQASRSESTDLIHLASLKKLKVFKLNCDYEPVKQLIDAFCEQKIAIEHLELAHGQLDVATIEAIAKIKTIKVLKFNNMINFDADLMMPIAIGLDQLEELHIKTEGNISSFRITEIVQKANGLKCLKIDAWDFGLNIDTYRAILTAVKSRTDNNYLAISIYSGKQQPKIPDEMLIGPNKEWLRVRQINRHSNDLFPLYSWPAPEEFETDHEFDGEVGWDSN